MPGAVLKEKDVMKDLHDRTSIRNINRIEIGKIDFMKGVCEVTIYYYVQEPEGNVNGYNKNEDDDDD